MARNEKLTFIIRAKNLFRGAFKKAQSSLKAIGSGAKRMAGVAAAAFAATAAAAGVLGKKLWQLRTESARSQKKLEQAVRTTGGAAGFTATELGKEAKALHELTGVSEKVIKNSQAIQLTFLNIKGDHFKELTARALDLAEVMSDVNGEGVSMREGTVRLAKALNDPSTGMANLRRVGISFTTQQVEQAKAMQKSGDLLGAQRLILDELDRELAGFAENTDKTTKAWNKLKASLEKAGAKLGAVLFGAKEGQSVLKTLREQVERLLVSGNLELWAERAVQGFQKLVAPVTWSISAFKKVATAAKEAGNTIGFMLEGYDLTAARRAGDVMLQIQKMQDAQRLAEIKASNAAIAREREKAEKTELAQYKLKAAKLAGTSSTAAAAEGIAGLDVERETLRKNLTNILNPRETQLSAEQIGQALDDVVQSYVSTSAKMGESMDREAHQLGKVKKLTNEMIIAQGDLVASEKKASASSTKPDQLADAEADVDRKKEVVKSMKALYDQENAEAKRQAQKPDEFKIGRTIIPGKGLLWPRAKEQETKGVEVAGQSLSIAESSLRTAEKKRDVLSDANAVERNRLAQAQYLVELDKKTLARKKAELAAINLIITGERATRKELAELLKKREALAKEAMKLQKTLEDFKKKKRDRIELQAKTDKIDAAIKKLRDDARDPLFLNVVDKRGEVETFLNNRKRAKRLSGEEAEDAKKFAKIQDRLNEGLRVTRKRREWLEDRRALARGQGIMANDAAAQAILIEQRAKAMAPVVTQLKTMNDNLNKLLVAE